MAGSILCMMVVRHLWKTYAKEGGSIAAQVVDSRGPFFQKKFYHWRRNMTEWSASEQRHCAVNLTLSLNYNINLQLSRGIYIE